MAVDKNNPGVENKGVVPAPTQPTEQPAKTLTFGDPNANDPANDPINDPRIAPEVRHEIEKARNARLKEIAGNPPVLPPDRQSMDSYQKRTIDTIEYSLVPIEELNLPKDDEAAARSGKVPWTKQFGFKHEWIDGREFAAVPSEMLQGVRQINAPAPGPENKSTGVPPVPGNVYGAEVKEKDFAGKDKP